MSIRRLALRLLELLHAPGTTARGGHICPFLAAAQFAQTVPLIHARTLVPTLKDLSMLKPNIGFANFASRQVWRDAFLAGAEFGVSVTIWPA